MGEHTEYDIGILIPLEEEFDIFTNLYEKGGYSVIAGETYFEIELFDNHPAVVTLVGEMGTTQAALSTQRLLTHFEDLSTVALIGIGGALDEELRLGDVVIADEIKSYLMNSKAIGGEDDYEIEYSGAHWRIPQDLKDPLVNFKHKHENLYQRWRAEARQFRNDQLDYLKEDSESPLFADLPEIHIGHVASGDIVSASVAHGEELRSLDRKLIAIEMEAGGFFAAVDRYKRVQPLMIRGISDFADERKRQLDQQDGVWRTYAMHNASKLLKYLLSSEKFFDVSLDPEKIEETKSAITSIPEKASTKETSDISTEYAYHLAYKKKTPPSEYLTEEEENIDDYTPELRHKIFERIIESSSGDTPPQPISGAKAKGSFAGVEIKASVLDGGRITGTIRFGETLKEVISIKNHRPQGLVLEIQIESVEGLLKIDENRSLSESRIIQLPAMTESIVEFPLSLSELGKREEKIITRVEVRDKFTGKPGQIVLEQRLNIE